MEPLLPPTARRRADKQEQQQGVSSTPSVTLRVFVNGQGPRFELKQPLLGWDADRLPVREIQEKCKVKALYAMSSSGSRGLLLLPNPRNGLSYTSYPHKDAAVIHLDADPQVPLLTRLTKLTGPVLLAVALCSAFLAWTSPSAFPEQWSHHFMRMNNYPSWPIIALGFLLFAFLFWKRLTSFNT